MNFSQLHKQYLVMLVVAGFLLVLLACGGNSDSGNGVARVGDAEPVPTKVATVQQVSHKQRFQKQSPIKQTKISHLNLLLVFEMKGSV